MRILMITDESGSQITNGGGLSYLLSILRPAIKLGHTVEYITADDLKANGMNNRNKKLEDLENKIKEFKPDIINIFNNCIWGFEPYDIADKYNIPTVSCLPDYTLICKRRMMFITESKEVCDLKNCNRCPNNRTCVEPNFDIFNKMKDRRIIVGSQFLKDIFMKFGYKNENISVIELGLNPKIYKPQYGGKSEEIFNISRMAEEKGLDLYENLASMENRLKWVLAGYPSLNLISNHMEYIGEISETDKMYHMRNCEMFVSTPRWHEPIGLTYLEAKAIGKPVITFRRGGIPQYHENTGGAVLVDYPNLKEMAKIVWELHLDEDKRIEMGKSGRKQIEERNNENILIHQTIKVFDELRGVR